MSEEDYKLKYLKYKEKYLNLKDQINKMKGGHIYQCFIDFIGTQNILASFAEFLGRPCNPETNIIIPGGRSLRHQRVDASFSGVVFSGAHWKGYENGRETYDSYVEQIQLPGTMNYCQSFAIYLWASKGLINPHQKVQLVKGEYVNNVKKISQLWLNFLNELYSYPAGKTWLDGQIKQLLDAGHCRTEGITTVAQFATTINNLLTQLISNDAVAREFAQSKL